MNICRIAGAADVACIEARPYAEFIAATNLLDALSEAARRHANRPALSFIESADIDAAPRVWSHAQFVAEVRRAANLFRHLAGAYEPRIAMLLPALPQAHFTLWGGEAAGVVCPINYLLNTEHIAELIRPSGANILVALGPN